jgi:hypothetical protein
MATNDDGSETCHTDGPLTLRLRCWYRDELGENQERNDSLAATFREKDLQGWRVEAVTLSAGNVKPGDKFVPISVRPRHNHPAIAIYRPSIILFSADTACLLVD